MITSCDTKKEKQMLEEQTSALLNHAWDGDTTQCNNVVAHEQLHPSVVYFDGMDYRCLIFQLAYGFGVVLLHRFVRK